MKKVLSVSACLIFLVAVAVLAFAQQDMMKEKMEAGKSEMKGMMDGAKEMGTKEGMMTEKGMMADKMDAGKSEMKGMMGKPGEMQKETTGMMK